jgi:hypothetical protein
MQDVALLRQVVMSAWQLRKLLGLAVLIGLLGAGCSTGGGGATSSAAPPELLPPTSFEAKAKQLTIRLTWKPDPAGAPVDGYRITRNGMKLVELGANTTKYEDLLIDAGKTYTYEIRSEAGTKASEPASSSITVKNLPLKAARLQSIFQFEGRVTSSTGFDRLTRRPEYSFTFLPKCQHGSCSVEWMDFGSEAQGVLYKKGPRYAGSYTGAFGIRCGSESTLMTTTVHLELVVTRAKVMDNSWRATKVRGTITTETPPQLGCGSSESTATLTDELP